MTYWQLALFVFLNLYVFVGGTIGCTAQWILQKDEKLTTFTTYAAGVLVGLGWLIFLLWLVYDYRSWGDEV